ncbi:MAG: hypothetical protein NC926_08885 [Candidatus Omnitrophica bacterium]|nr:hypothetical protein [Candidatus Omnitrophota bacterium]
MYDGGVNGITTLIFDIYDREYKKFIKGENVIVTGTDELLIKRKWGYRSAILNINGEVVDYLVYKYY